MRTRDLLVGIAMLGGVVVACSDAFAGSGDGNAMTLTDENGNVLELRKRS
ncbi:MAG TPA: hypothetical protein VGA02_13315 [Gemmatimonadales bacterium]|jgi:hypothetical protein